MSTLEEMKQERRAKMKWRKDEGLARRLSFLKSNITPVLFDELRPYIHEDGSNLIVAAPGHRRVWIEFSAAQTASGGEFITGVEYGLDGNRFANLVDAMIAAEFV